MSKLILHLDDEPSIREILQESLAGLGYRVVSVATPTEALNVARQERPDVLISDLQLDEGDGLETIGEIRALHADLRVIILTGVLVDPRVASKSFARDAQAYLTKTDSLAKIIAEVRRVAGD
jgi:CheY-like chemotaxis protein